MQHSIHVNRYNVVSSQQPEKNNSFFLKIAILKIWFWFSLIEIYCFARFQMRSNKHNTFTYKYKDFFFFFEKTKSMQIKQWPPLAISWINWYPPTTRPKKCDNKVNQIKIKSISIAIPVLLTIGDGNESARRLTHELYFKTVIRKTTKFESNKRITELQWVESFRDCFRVVRIALVS